MYYLAASAVTTECKEAGGNVVYPPVHPMQTALSCSSFPPNLPDNSCMNTGERGFEQCTCTAALQRLGKKKQAFNTLSVTALRQLWHYTFTLPVKVLQLPKSII